MIKVYALLVFCMYLVSCASVNSHRDVEFDVNVDEMTAAIYTFRQSDSNLLFMFQVDEEGSIVKSKLIESKISQLDEWEVRRYELLLIRNLNFGKSSKNSRTMFHGVDFKRKAVFK